MLKQEVKDICENDDKMQWWAMLLFAELSDLIHHCEHDYDDVILKVIINKIKEFERIIVMEKAKDSRNKSSILERLKKIEEKLGVKN